MKVILVDDEPIAIGVLEYILSKYEDIDILGSYTDPNMALKEINELQPDVVFLDIEMGAMNGLEIAQLFLEQQDTLEIVFVTAHSQYAVEAFEINAMDYLLKPIQEKRVYKTIQRLGEEIKNNNDNLLEILDNRLRINSFGSFEVVDRLDNPLIWRTQKTKELFAYLWEQKGRPVSKVLIMETLYPDKDIDKAITLLHTTVYQLRKNLDRLGFHKGIIYFNESYQLNVPIESDLDELDKILKSNVFNEENIKKIFRIYKGGFLEEEGYHWAMGIQQRYKDIVFNIFENFAYNQLKLGRLNSILKICLETMINIDPFNESTAKLMIQYYGVQNKKLKLEMFFKSYVENLWQDMNLRPMESTIELYNRYIEKMK